MGMRAAGERARRIAVAAWMAWSVEVSWLQGNNMNGGGGRAT